MINFQEAARRQYRRATFYTVWLIGPDGTRISLGSTARKSGAGLLAILREETTQALVRQLFTDAESVRLTRYAERLAFSNGWKMHFGDTIRQELTAQANERLERINAAFGTSYPLTPAYLLAEAE